MNKGISILLAVYNGEKYIEQSLNSIIGQTFKEWECIIGFNGTKDNSKKIVEKIISQDNRFKIFDFGDDKGKAKTLNKILPLAKNDWIAIQDDDDIWLPKKLENQIQYIDTYDVIGTNCQYINENEEYIGHPNISSNHNEIINKSLNGENQVINTSAIFKKEKALEVSGWDETIDGIEDYDFWLKLMILGCKFININKILVCHRLHTKSNFNTKKHDTESLIKKYKKNVNTI
jgi:glycosyltransferase involved in cell wall biosynthesis